MSEPRALTAEEISALLGLGLLIDGNATLAVARLVFLESERENEFKRCRMDELDAVMHSVDKWLAHLPKNDKRRSYNPATRASDAREIALQAIETLTARLREAERLLREAADRIDEDGSPVLSGVLRAFLAEGQ